MPTVEANGVDVYFEQYGEGPPIVFLHGGGSDHRIWAERSRALADEYTVVVPDLRGHGYTGGTDLSTYTVDTYVEDVRALIDALELERPVLCGLSFGGMIAQRYAATHPGTISGLVTLGAPTPKTFSWSEWVQRVGLLKLLAVLGRVVDTGRIENALDWLFVRIHGEEAAGDLDKAERLQAEHDPGVPEMSEAEGEKQLSVVTDYTTCSIDYGAISVRALLLYGEREFDGMADHAERMADLIPDAEAREIPDAGHNSHVDNPEFVVDAIREFARRRADTDGGE